MNYFSVSLVGKKFLTSFSKFFEKIMQSRLLKHAHNILYRELQGFQVNLTTGNASSKLINEILNVLNNKLRVGVIFCDLVMKS